MSRSNPARLARLARALAAARAAEEGKLAALNRQVGAMRAEADDARHRSTIPATEAPTDALDLLADTAWRNRLRIRAADLEAEAEAALRAAAPLRASLAALLGRERALDDLVERTRRAQKAEREIQTAEADALRHAQTRTRQSRRVSS